MATVQLSSRQRRLIELSFNEAGGGSTAAFIAISGRPTEVLARSRRSFAEAAGDRDHVDLSDEEWRTVYDVVHGAMYALGPFELPIIFGCSLAELADVNLRICVDVWGAYGGLTWMERE